MKTTIRSAFTLVELLVVIAIIGILVALLLPAVQPRGKLRRISCTNNLSQFAFALQNYESSYRVYPPGTLEQKGPIVNSPQGYHHNWLIQLLPYIEEKNTYNHIDFSVGVYDEKNAPVRKNPAAAIPLSIGLGSGGCGDQQLCGVHHDQDQPIDVTNHGIFFLNSAVRYEDIKDGSANTIFVGERVTDLQQDLGWMSGTRSTLRNTGLPINAALANTQRRGSNVVESLDAPGADISTVVGGFSSRHPGGAQFLFGDGHVQFLSQTIAIETYQQLGHRADGKLLAQDF